MSQRFSKATLAEDLYGRMEVIMRKHKFDLGNGTSQLKPNDPVRAAEYGEYRALEGVMNRYSLWDHLPDKFKKL